MDGNRVSESCGAGQLNLFDGGYEEKRPNNRAIQFKPYRRDSIIHQPLGTTAN